MKLTASAQFLETAFGSLEAAKKLFEDLRWKTGGQRVAFNAEDLSEENTAKILQHAANANHALHAKLSSYLILKRNPEGESVKTLAALEVAITEYIRKAEHRFVFTHNDDGVLVPYLLVHCEYHAAYYRDGYRHPAFVYLKMEAIFDGEAQEKSVRFGEDTVLGRRKVSEVMEDEELYRETPESFALWEQHLSRYKELLTMTGTQFLASGYGFAERESSNWWRSSNEKTISLTRDGVPTRVVIDNDGDPDDEKERDDDDKHERTQRYCAWWKNNKNDKDDEPEDSEATDLIKKYTFIKPIHPYIQIFSLDSHEFITAHVTALKPYVYKTNLESKLILPAAVKELVTVLIEGAAHHMEDIVTGKVGGVIVIATGLPGTGKTLTAEVYSEQIKRPLYVIQCAQLGTEEEKLEEQLGVVLKRATRWNAILLIDEADVYVRARENDLQQNAIVGVFLRMLERFQGVLFMTSNRPDAIDDAIMSRAIAHIKYDLPDANSLKQIWRVLSDNYDVDLTDKEIETLIKEFPCISGRNVKTLLKLATAVSISNFHQEKKGIELIRRVAPFVTFPTVKNVTPTKQ
jgi:hypothetical protein